MLALAIAGLVASCGGSGSGGSGGSGSGGSGSAGQGSRGITGGSSGGGGTSWVAGVFRPSTGFAALCAAPRRGSDPYTHAAYPDLPGSTLDEDNWLRSWTHELYLWYGEVVDQDPSLYANTADYFAVLKTSATTASGSPKDRFHFTYATAYWESLSQSSTTPGYGVTWAVIAAAPPRQVLVAYTEPGSQAVAAPANLVRGASVLAIDGVDINTSTQANVTTTPVQAVHAIVTNSGTVGYMLFNDHLAASESELVNAFNSLKSDSVGDLILDIRYNGGGFLDIASEVAYMIAGPGPTTGQTFERSIFNDRYPATNPVTGQALTPLGFHNTTQGFSIAAGQALPTLNLARVFVLTGSNTCSASESIINSLRGVNVQVIQIGSTTCGKPYGFYPQDNCGTTYFSIQFMGVNARDFGAYSDGFSPANSTTAAGAPVTGCSVADDFAHLLGDGSKARLAAALQYRSSGACPIPPTSIAMSSGIRAASAAQAATDGPIYKSPWHENRILRQQAP